MDDELAVNAGLLALPDLVHQLQVEVSALRVAVEKMAAHQPLVDIKTAAEHMGVSTRTLQRMVRSELVPYRRIGRTLRFNVALLAPRT